MTAMPTGEPIRILVVEDQQLIRRAFAAMLDLEPDIEVVGQAADGAEGIELVRRFRPDVVLMDIQMPRVGGIAATKKILAEFPAQARLALPMRPGNRSLNVSNAVAIVVYEAWRQNGFG